MKIVAYIYSEPILEEPPPANIWGLEVDRVYQDLGERQQLEQLIADCRQESEERPYYLLLRRLEELGDELETISDRLHQLESLGIEIIVTEQDYSSQQWNQLEPEQLKHNLSQLLQQLQASKQRTKLELGHARNRLKILPPPGKAPYGYRRGQDKYIIDRSTAPVVKDFFDRFILFGSLRGAVRYLEKRYGKKISPTTGRNWLSNPVYRGNLRYKNNEIVAQTHAAIIDAEEAAQIDRLLRRNRRLPSRIASAPRSLAGLVVCQQCGLNFNIVRVTQHSGKTEYLYLRCQKCPQNPKCRGIAYKTVLQLTITKICQELPQAVAKLPSTAPDSIDNKLQQQLEQKQNAIARLPQLVKDDVLDRETADLRNYKLRTEIAQLESQIAQLPPRNLQAIAKAVSLKEFWLDLSESERRFYFREFIKQIEIIRQSDRTLTLNLTFVF